MQSLSSNVRAYPLNMSRTAFSKVSKSHQKSAKVSGVVVLAKKKISTLIYNRYIYNIYIIYSYIYIIYIHQHMHRKGATVPPFTYIMLPIYMYIYICISRYASQGGTCIRQGRFSGSFAFSPKKTPLNAPPRTLRRALKCSRL